LADSLLCKENSAGRIDNGLEFRALDRRGNYGDHHVVTLRGG
jgi:hypothetical protein